jgi:hypothetical protein
MSAQRAYKNRPASDSRSKAIASIQINWKKISPDGDRDERLAWIAAFLKLPGLGSLTDLTDAQLGAVAGEMKRLTGAAPASVPASKPRSPFRESENGGTVVEGDFGSANIHRGVDTSNWSVGCITPTHLASHEQVYTLTKLQNHLEWDDAAAQKFINKRLLKGKFNFGTITFRRLTFKQATNATNALLHVAAHRDLKRRTPDKPVSRDAINKYIPELKEVLGIDQRR